MKRANIILLGYVVVVLLMTTLVAVAYQSPYPGASIGHIGLALALGLGIGFAARLVARLFG